jgi:hypothetical protein
LEAIAADSVDPSLTVVEPSRLGIEHLLDLAGGGNPVGQRRVEVFGEDE